MTDTSKQRAGPADGTFDAYQRRSRFSNLDGVRFFCIFAVLWHHGPVLQALDNPAMILRRGFLGVDFFFVLSGFLITTLLLREEARNGRFSLRGFYWRRLLRIIPVYFFVVTLVSAYYVLVKGQAHFAPLVPYYYLFLANFLPRDIPLLAPMWSLAVEEQYYLIWPLLLLLLPRRAVLPVLGVLVALNVAGVMGLLAVFGLHAFDLGILHIALPNATYAPILMGSAVAVMLHHRRGFEALQSLFGGRLTPILVVVALLVAIELAPPDVRGLPNLAIHLLMSASLISLVVRDRNILSPIMTWRPIARVGEISYGIYLYHLIAMYFASIAVAHLHVNTPWVLLVAYIALSIVIAEISFRTLEQFFRQFRHGIRGRAVAE